MKTYLTIFILTIFVMTNCTTAKKCARKYPNTATYDSVYIETIKEIPVLIPGDTIKIELPVDCPDQDLGIIETEKYKQEISILNKKLKSKVTIKADTVKIYVPEIHEMIKEVRVPEKIKYVPKLTRFLSVIGIISLLALIALFALKTRKFWI